MKAFRAVFPMILTAFVATVACGDDDDDGKGNQGTAGTGGGTAGNCKGVYAGINQTTLKQGVSPGACSSDADLTSICAHDVNTIAQNCGIRCFTQNTEREAQATCMRACLPPQLTPTPPTAACQECYVETVLCAIAGCAAICIDPAKATECAACREDKGCTPNFYSCSGLPLPDGTKTGAGGDGAGGAAGSGGAGGSAGSAGAPTTGGAGGSGGEAGAGAGAGGETAGGAGGAAGEGGAGGDTASGGIGGLGLAAAAGTLPG